jgi:hypothetical protein
VVDISFEELKPLAAKRQSFSFNQAKTEKTGKMAGKAQAEEGDRTTRILVGSDVLLPVATM